MNPTLSENLEYLVKLAQAPPENLERGVGAPPFSTVGFAGGKKTRALPPTLYPTQAS